MRIELLLFFLPIEHILIYNNTLKLTETIGINKNNKNAASKEHMRKKGKEYERKWKSKKNKMFKTASLQPKFNKNKKKVKK